MACMSTYPKSRLRFKCPAIRRKSPNMLFASSVHKESNAVRQFCSRLRPWRSMILIQEWFRQTKPKKVRFAKLSGKDVNEGGGFGTPFLREFGEILQTNGGSGTFRTPSPKVRELHFLRFGLPELLLIDADTRSVIGMRTQNGDGMPNLSVH